jgi:hypothetical protein
LIISRQPIPEVSYESYEDTVMSDENHFDVAEHVYEGAKGVWGWGKGVSIINPFLGIAETVAGKVAGVVGTSLEAIDGTIKPKLHEFDDGVLNPSIAKIVGIILATVSKGDETLRPIIEAILGPLGIIKKKIEDGEAEEEVTSEIKKLEQAAEVTPEVNKLEPAPEVTTSTFGRVSMSLGMSK